MKIYCVQCNKEVVPNKLLGANIYSHRGDLRDKLFYQCPRCGNYVGAHKDGRPLGTIPTPPLRAARHRVHNVIDKYWLPTKDRKKRKELYTDLSRFMGKEYHTGELNSIGECEKIICYFLNKYENKTIAQAPEGGEKRNNNQSGK